MLDLALLQAKERFAACRLLRSVEAHVFAIRAAIPEKLVGMAPILELVANAGARDGSRPLGETRVEVPRLLAGAVARPSARMALDTLSVARNGIFARAALVFRSAYALPHALHSVAFSLSTYVATRPLLVAIAPAVGHLSAQLLAVVLGIVRAARGRHDGYPAPNPKTPFS